MEPVATRAIHIGLTGGIGSGKSTVAAMFVERGATLVDTDAIARQITLPGGTAIAALTQAFGAEMLSADGGLDRSAMRMATKKGKTNTLCCICSTAGAKTKRHG